jgi:hypothetical protein
MTAFLPMFIQSSGTAGVQTFAAHAFAMTDFAGTTAALAAFDQYRIDQLETWLTAENPNQAGNFPILTSCIDLDDANVPTVVGGLEDHIGAIVSDGPGGHYHKWKPHIAVATFSGAFTSYANMPSQFIDSASPGVQHFGLKAGVYSNGVSIPYGLVFRALVTLRAPLIS